ncbi:translocation/assembly module TamB domain-containing protein [Pseudomonas sp. HR96]|uniref:translocation/assembly module TamB domain-containing protein n=1 Tax=Pseudomonas sp. HR96 TaxID=1027966 RepID=UPI002A75EE78|nr:translocation/assembly module TamB domain-containing protein [Pseudomonas sp. HR96]WPP02192.1 translocation/assembly module TamB domain-containing protein [Pseudomonas sp. HR96]
MRRTLKWTAIAGASLLALLLLAVLAVYLTLTSESGSRWLLARVPGVQVEQFSGQLAGSWSATRLTWQQGADRVQVQAPALAWTPACLLRGALCIERLHADKVELSFPASAAPAGTEPTRLPALKLPVAIELGELQLGSLWLDGSQLLENARLAAHWRGSELRIDSAHVQHGDLQLDLSGTLQPNGDWPLQASAQLQLPAVDGRSWQLALQAQGPLQGALQLSGQSSGYLDGKLVGQVQALAEHLPAQLRISADAFKASAGLPDTLTLEQLVLDANGDLLQGYRIDGTAQLPAQVSLQHKGPISLALHGRADAQKARIDALQLLAADDQRLELSGLIDWQQGLLANAKLHWQDFPWERLYPQPQPVPVKLRRFDAEIDYRDGNYLGNLNGDLDGPAGAFSVLTPFSGNLQQLFLPQLEVTAGKGKASGRLALQFADAIKWDTALELANIDPAYWLAELPGNLGGTLNSTGQLHDGQLDLDLGADIKGRLRGQPALLQAQVKGTGQRWEVSALQARLGDNRIQGTGRLEQKLAAHLDIDLPRLGQLWPGLQGQLKGQWDAAGSLQAPQGQLQLRGQQLAMSTARLQTLTLSAAVDARQHGSLDLTATGLHSGDTDLGTLTAKGGGDLRQQALQLGLQGPLLKLALALDGGLAQNDWRGRLVSGQVQSGGQNWQLQAPARLERLANGTINFGAHCWRSGPASLCGEDQRLAPEPRLRYHLKDFPLDSLRPWLPRDLAWQGSLNADLAVDLPASGPKGRIVVDASGGSLRIRDQRQWLDFPYQALNLTSQLSPQRVDTELIFAGGKLGNLRVSTRINPLANGKPISGEFNLSGLDISVARPFVPQVEKLAGHLDGHGQLAGTLLAPQVNGTLTLSGAELSGGDLPTPLQDLRINAAISGEHLQLDGGWKAGDSGQGSLGGQVDWARGLAAQLWLKGTRLPVTVEPYATLEAQPDLKIELADNRLAVSGKVSVPKGAITVRQLPPTTVKLSDDTVIVGAQAPAAEKPMAIAMDIDVVVGEDKLSFNGFGLTANLAGRVHIGDNLDTRGELNLNDGRYRAYGQRLTIRRARLLFAGPIDQPYLDIEAIRQVDDVIAGIRLSGSAEEPTSTVFAEPAMDQQEALSYLVLGRPLSTSGEDNNMLAQAALALGLAGSSSTAGKLASDLGIKDFQLDTQGSGNTTSVVASGNLTDKLILRYGVGVFEPANTIALRYLLSKKVYVEAASGVASSLDIFYKRDF